MSKYLTEIADVEDCIRNNGYDLINLSMNFHATGNEYIGDILRAIGQELITAQQDLSKTVCAEIRDRCDSSMKFTEKLVDVALSDSLKN